jgi:LPXTG-site transpeptidase (sortase) family protein
MKPLILRKRPFIYFSITGIIFFLIIILLINVSIPVKNSYAKATPITKVTSAKTVTASLMRLKIPKIKIDTNLEQVGLTAKGAVGVPKSILNAAWFNGSSLPGRTGNSVIVGHFGYINGVAAIFNNLTKLKQGDKVYVATENGSSITFVVKKIQSYPQTAKIPGVFVSSDGKSHLNLITCNGIWNKITQSYSQRLIVYTEKY